MARYILLHLERKVADAFRTWTMHAAVGAAAINNSIHSAHHESAIKRLTLLEAERQEERAARERERRQQHALGALLLGGGVGWGGGGGVRLPPWRALAHAWERWRRLAEALRHERWLREAGRGLERWRPERWRLERGLEAAVFELWRRHVRYARLEARYAMLLARDAPDDRIDGLTLDAFEPTRQRPRIR